MRTGLEYEAVALMTTPYTQLMVPHTLQKSSSQLSEVLSPTQIPVHCKGMYNIYVKDNDVAQRL